MAEPSHSSQLDAGRDAPRGLAPRVRLEVIGPGSPAVFAFEQDSVLVGSVAGCDLRLPGAELPAVVCLLLATPHGLQIRKLAPALKLLVNGQEQTQSALRNGDRLGIGPTLIRIEYAPAAADPRSQQALGEQHRFLREGLQKLAEAQRQFEADQADWEQDAERQAETLALRSRQLLDREQSLASACAALERRETGLQREREELDQREADLKRREHTQAREEQELTKVRADLDALRQRTYESYRKRRDSLLALQDSVHRAAGKVQADKRIAAEQQAEAEELAAQLRRDREQLATETACLAEARTAVGRQHQLLEEWQKDLEREHTERQAAHDAESRRLQEERAALEKGQALHQADLVRLERFHASLQERQSELDRRSAALDERTAQLRTDSAELEEQTRQMEEWDARLRAASAELSRRRAELDAEARNQAERITGLETQQSVLVTLRNRNERLHAELLQREQQLTEQRVRQDQMESALRDASRQLREQQAQLYGERETWRLERQRMETRCSGLETALEQMREVQRSFETEHARLQALQAALDERTCEAAQVAQLLRQRAERVHALRARLVRERRGLQQRADGVQHTDQAREALQEQLRRRSEALGERERSLAEQQRQTQDSLASLQAERERWLAEQSQREQTLQNREQALSDCEARLQKQSEDVQARNASLADERARLDALHHEVATERDTTLRQLTDLQARVPELTEQAVAVLGRLGKAREQLRSHLAEVHGYVQQCHAELAEAQRELAAQLDQSRAQQRLVVQAQHDHRHAVTSFRQQLGDWQQQLGELRDSLRQGETRLDLRKAELEQQAKQIEDTTQRLAKRAEELDDQERDVTLRRDEINRHLFDMQQWYRHKLRELAERRLLTPPAASDDSVQAAEPTILPLTPPLSPSDQALANLLTHMELIDGKTLDALLAEARRRSCSLRDALLQGEYLTPYQVELIEAGKLEALALGPVRIVDRLVRTPLATVYRVFDPRRGCEALLRQLTPAVSEAKKAEFRARFQKAAAVQHGNVAKTLEVLEMEGSPAALQEWVTGLPSDEWAEYAAVPGVWLRLLAQAAAGLQAAHAAGVEHGRLHAGRLLLTESGELKVCGLGEPAWLFPEWEHSARALALTGARGDLYALGKIAEEWLSAAPRNRLGRGPTETLQGVVQKLLTQDAGSSYTSAAQLLAELERLRGQVPDDPAAWERLLAAVRERLGVDESPIELRKSA